ncbi:MFS transporter [Acinetobacter thermotolerans]|uniref:MFS transporter n=1 Tax=Acinetobacter thermotolerans TaxID=3151487 RepID=UPI00325B8482
MYLLPASVRALPRSQWQRIATALCFFALGFSTAAWAPLIPLVQQRLNLSHSDFGVLLLGAGVGSMIAMPLAGRLAHRFGCRPVIATVLAAFAVILPALALSPSKGVLAAALFAFGSSAGALGVSVNLQAIKLESQQRKSMMSLFHGICSLGGLAGVLGMTTMLGLGLAVPLSALVISLSIMLVMMLAVPFCLKAEAPATETTQVSKVEEEKYRPSFAILCMGLICFIAFLSEGAAMDWSGIYLNTLFKVEASQAGLAYSCFAALMVAGRLSGHLIIKFFGEKNTILYSAALAGLGLLTVVFAPVWYVALIGYAILGLGSANIVPLMFSRAGRQPNMPKHIALSYVSIFAYTGSLLGPALVGFGSEMIGLSHVFFVIAVGLIGITVLNQMSSAPATAAEKTQTPA